MNLRQAPLAAFLVLAVAGSVGLSVNASQSTEKLKQTQTAACQRANELRLESNKRITSHLILRDAAVAALNDQAVARRASYRKMHQHADLIASKRAEKTVRLLNSKVVYHKTPIVPCAGAPDVRGSGPT